MKNIIKIVCLFGLCIANVWADGRSGGGTSGIPTGTGGSQGGDGCVVIGCYCTCSVDVVNPAGEPQPPFIELLPFGSYTVCIPFDCNAIHTGSECEVPLVNMYTPGELEEIGFPNPEDFSAIGTLVCS